MPQARQAALVALVAKVGVQVVQVVQVVATAKRWRPRRHPELDAARGVLFVAVHGAWMALRTEAGTGSAQMDLVRG